MDFTNLIFPHDVYVNALSLNKIIHYNFLTGVWCRLAPGGCGDLPEAGESPGGAAEAAGGGAAAE